jgi:hypothetical protein
MPCLGASNTGSSPTPFCLATAPGPLAADRCSIVRGRSRPPPHLRHQTAPQLLPAVTAARGGSFHPTRLNSASWRRPALDDLQQSAGHLSSLFLLGDMNQFHCNVACIRALAEQDLRTSQSARTCALDPVKHPIYAWWSSTRCCLNTYGCSQTNTTSEPAGHHRRP